MHKSEELLANVSALNAWLDLLEDNVSAAGLWAEMRGIETDHEQRFLKRRTLE